MTGKSTSSFFGATENDPSITDIEPLRRICFTGVRGVGKSTVLKDVIEGDIDMCFTSGSDILQEMMGETYSQFEYLPEEEKYAYRLKIRDVLHKSQEQEKKDLLVDSHLTVYNLKTGEIDVIFTHRDYDFYTDIILLDASPELILRHRKRDTKKERIADLNIIRKELDFERKMAKEISEEYGIRLHLIQMGEHATESLEIILNN